MNRTSIMLPDTLKIKAINFARDEGVSLGEFIRESLEMRFQKVVSHEKRDSFFAEEHVFSGPAPTHLAENHDDYLY